MKIPRWHGKKEYYEMIRMNDKDECASCGKKAKANPIPYCKECWIEFYKEEEE